MTCRRTYEAFRTCGGAGEGNRELSVYVYNVYFMFVHMVGVRIRRVCEQ